MVKLVVILAGITYSLSVAQSNPATYSIDLVSTPRSTDEQVFSIPEAEQVNIPLRPPPVIGQPWPVPSVVLTAISFDRNDYKPGDPFVYELQLRYTGSVDFTFPSSAEKHLFRKGMSGLRMATLSVEFKDDVLGHQIANTQALYGSTEVPGSLLTLSNSQTVRITGQGRWVVRGDQLPISWSRALSPFAGLSLHFTPQHYSQGQSPPGSIQFATVP